MNVDVESVWKMEVRTFFLHLKHLKAIQGEENYTLQKQLDNHIKFNHKKTVRNAKDIYDEFSKDINSVGKIKYIDPEYTQEEMKEIHKENLKKFGL